MNTQSARNVTEFVHILARDDQNRPTRLLVPGHEGRQYGVRLSRNGAMTAYCYLLDHYGVEFVADCKGASHNICYHILAACMVAAEEQGKQVYWYNDEQEAQYKAELHNGEPFSVKSAQSGKVAWGVTLGGETEPAEGRGTITRLAEDGLSQDALVKLALDQTGDKSQWYTGEVMWLAPDAFLKNDDGMVRLYRIDRSQKYPRPEMLATVYRLDPRSGAWKPQAQLTPAQAKVELFDDRDSAIPVEYKRGRNKLFKI